MTLGEFHTLLQDTLGRGTSLASVIPGYVKRAARWIERNQTYQYMRRWVELDVNSSSSKPYLISLYGYEIKRIDALRYVGSDGRFHKLKGPINPLDRDTRIAGLPSAFWLDGMANIVLDSIPEENLSLEGNFVCYSEWPTEDDAKNWLLNNAEDALLAKSMMNAAVQNRDERLYNAWRTSLLDALQTLHIAEYDLVEGSKDEVQIWTPQWDELESNSRNRS